MTQPPQAGPLLAGFTTQIRADPPYDYRDDPDDERGCHGMELRFILIGPLGAMTWALMTGFMHRPLVGAYRSGVRAQSRRDRPGIDPSACSTYPATGSLASHSSIKTKDWWAGPEDCDILGGQCWSNYSYMVGTGALEALMTGGDGAVFEYLRQLYYSWLGPDDDD